MSEPNYYLMDGEKTVGPFLEGELREKLARGELQPEILCAIDGADGWAPLIDALPPVGSAKRKTSFYQAPPAIPAKPAPAPAPAPSAPVTVLAQPVQVFRDKRQGGDHGIGLLVIGVILLVIGLLGLMCALVYSTTNGDTHNIGMISERETLCIISAAITLLGGVFVGAGAICQTVKWASP